MPYTTEFAQIVKPYWTDKNLYDKEFPTGYSVKQIEEIWKRELGIYIKNESELESEMKKLNKVFTELNTFCLTHDSQFGLVNVEEGEYQKAYLTVAINEEDGNKLIEAFKSNPFIDCDFDIQTNLTKYVEDNKVHYYTNTNGEWPVEESMDFWFDEYPQFNSTGCRGMVFVSTEYGYFPDFHEIVLEYMKNTL